MKIADTGLPENDENNLIPEDDLISALVEDIHLQRGSYQIWHAESGESIDGETKSDLIGLFVIQGTIDVALESRDVERLSTADSILIAPPAVFRVEAVPGDCGVVGCMNYSFDATPARQLFRLLPPAMVIHDVDAKDAEWHMHLSRLIFDRAGSRVNAAINRRLVEAALIDTIQQFLARNPPPARPTAADLLMRTGPSLQAMHRFPERKWTLRALARLAGMSRTAFAADFKEVTGETPARYLTGLRLDRAQHLLRQSKLPLAMIAHRAGYGTDVAFARAFRRRFNTSPARYRAAKRPPTA